MDRGVPRVAGLPAPAIRELAAAGIGLAGVLDVAAYDGLVPPAWQSASLLPSCRAVVVLGSGGRDLFAAVTAGTAASAEIHVDAFVRDALGRASRQIRSGGWALRQIDSLDRREGQFLDLVALARAAGMGAPSPSPLGLLLHPVYGPWWSLRACWLVDRQLPATLAASASDPANAFDPCRQCPAPCATACPANAVVHRPHECDSAFDVGICAAHRTDGGCGSSCAARRACPIGSEFAYTAQAEAHHMTAVLPMLASRSSRGAPESE